MVVDVPRDVRGRGVDFAGWPVPRPGRGGPDAPLAGPADLAFAASLLARTLRASESSTAAAGPGRPARPCRPGRAARRPGGHHAHGPGTAAPGPPASGRHDRDAARRRPTICSPAATCSWPWAPASTTGPPATPNAFAPGASVVHIDIDPSEHGKNRAAHVPLAGDAARTLDALIPPGPGPARPGPGAAIRASLTLAHPYVLPGLDDPKSPYGVLVSAMILGPEAVVATDVGQNQMRAAQAWPCHAPGKFLTSGGLGTMGFGLPAAIGAALADPSRPVACVTGDGGLLMNVRSWPPWPSWACRSKSCSWTTACLSSCGGNRPLFVGGRYLASTFAARPDFVALAASFGIAAIDLEPCRDVRAALAAVLAAPGPALARIPVDPDAHRLSHDASSAANHEMILEIRHDHAAS